MIQLILILIGTVVFLVGELWGVHNHNKHKIDTASEVVWWTERKWRGMYIVVGVFVISLFGHFMWHWGLLP